MLTIKSVIERTGPFASNRATTRLVNKIRKEALQKVLGWWHRIYLPKHFGSPAAVEARYPGKFAKRSKRYQMRKASKMGHTNLNVWTGAMEAMALAANPPTGGTSKRAWLKIRHPNRAKRNRDGGWTSQRFTQIDRELEASNKQEGNDLARRLDKWISVQLARLRKSNPERIVVTGDGVLKGAALDQAA